MCAAVEAAIMGSGAGCAGAEQLRDTGGSVVKREQRIIPFLFSSGKMALLCCCGKKKREREWEANERANERTNERTNRRPSRPGWLHILILLLCCVLSVCRAILETVAGGRRPAGRLIEKKRTAILPIYRASK